MAGDDHYVSVIVEDVNRYEKCVSIVAEDIHNVHVLAGDVHDVSVIAKVFFSKFFHNASVIVEGAHNALVEITIMIP